MGPYTTITVEEYNHMQAVIIKLRWRIQKARQLLEQELVEKALAILAGTEEEK